MSDTNTDTSTDTDSTDDGPDAQSQLDTITVYNRPIDDSGRITIPISARQRLDLDEGDMVDARIEVIDRTGSDPT